MTTRESWGNDSPLDMPGCKLLYKVIQRDIKGEGTQRRETKDHFLPLSRERRHKIRVSEDQNKILTTVQLIDDVTLASSMRTMTKELTEIEKNKIKFRIHITALHQVLLTMFQCSAYDKETGRLQPTKLNIMKSIFGGEQVLFLGQLFRPGKTIID